MKNIPIIHELRTFRCDINPSTPSPKKIDDQTQEYLFMGYTKIRAKMKLWNPYTSKLKYCSFAKFDKHNNKFEKRWSPGSVFINGTNISSFTKLKIYLSYNPFIKDDIFGATVEFPPRSTLIGVVPQYFNHQNMSYVSQSTSNSTCKRSFPSMNITNVFIIIIGIKEPTTFKKSWNLYQINGSQENTMGFTSSQHAETIIF